MTSFALDVLDTVDQHCRFAEAGVAQFHFDVTRVRCLLVRSMALRNIRKD